MIGGNDGGTTPSGTQGDAKGGGVTISYSNTIAPKWDPLGSFTWDVGFSTSGKNGWIVQKIDNAFSAETSSGPITTTLPTPSYYEAWKVDGSSGISPSAGATHDMWRRPGRGNGTKGNWSMVGTCYFTSQDPTSLRAGSVPDAGILRSSTSAPAGLGSALLTRTASGSWDDLSAEKKNHSGTAG